MCFLHGTGHWDAVCGQGVEAAGLPVAQATRQPAAVGECAHVSRALLLAVAVCSLYRRL